MALIGNTVRIYAEFRDWSKALGDPTELTLTFYDRRRNVLSTVPAASIVKDELGKYHYDYTIPDTASPVIVYEFKGKLSATPIVTRGEIPVRWS